MRLSNGFGALGLAALLAACSGAPRQPDGPVVREAAVERLDVRDQNFTTFTAVAPVQIRPDRQVQAVQATWEITVNGEPGGSGTTPLSVDVPAGGGIVEVPVTARYGEGARLAEVLQSERPVAVVLRGTVHTSDGTEWSFQRAGRVRAPRVPTIEVWHVEAGSFPQENEINLVFHVRVENRNPFEIQVEQMDYDLAINGTRLIEQGTVGRAARVPSASVAQLEIPLTLHKGNFPEVTEAIRRRIALDYLLDGTVRLGVGRIPVELTGPISLP